MQPNSSYLQDFLRGLQTTRQESEVLAPPQIVEPTIGQDVYDVPVTPQVAPLPQEEEPEVPSMQNFFKRIIRQQQVDSTGKPSLTRKMRAVGSKNPNNMPVSNVSSQAASNAVLQAGGSPDIVQRARRMLGKKEFINWCQAFVRTVTGSNQFFGSAINAWKQQKNKAIPSLKGIKPGDAIYFSANSSNRGYGHTGIYAGNNQFISPTGKGVQQLPISNWINTTGQQVLGYIPQGRR